LIFLAEGSLPWFQINSEATRMQVFKQVKEMKVIYHLKLKALNGMGKLGIIYHQTFYDFFRHFAKTFGSCR
jgi:hypothetical protein